MNRKTQRERKFSVPHINTQSSLSTMSPDGIPFMMEQLTHIACNEKRINLSGWQKGHKNTARNNKNNCYVV